MRSGGSSGGDWTGGVVWWWCTQLLCQSCRDNQTDRDYGTRDMSGASNLNKFVLEAGPEDCIVKCRITRNCKGLDKGEQSGLDLLITTCTRYN